MKLNAAAKINLMLDILGKTEDGYHNLFMIMQSVSIYDMITLEPSEKPGKIDLTCSVPDLPCDSHNIAYKAADLFFKSTKIENPGIHIDIQKQIPFEAGLAGGSADAAAVLIGLNKMLHAGMDVESLCNIGVKIGADVPFCIKGGTMAALDIGEVLAPLPPVQDNFYVLVKPNQGVSTKAAYDLFDACTEIRHLDTSGILRAIATKNEKKMYQLIGNVFEQFIEVPDRIEIKTAMRRHNALAYCMSGSGPTVYGIFDTEIRARSCAAELQKKWDDVFVCRPIKSGVEIIEE